VPLDDVVFSEPVQLLPSRGNGGTVTDVVFDIPVVKSLGSLGGGVAVRLLGNVFLHIADRSGMPVNEIIVVTG
jgi:hypothetical protein